jgi:hypothetical protein
MELRSTLLIAPLFPALGSHTACCKLSVEPILLHVSAEGCVSG